MDVEIFFKSPLKGEIEVPGDKSISHRAIFISALAEGKSKIKNFLYADDCLKTVDLVRSLGVYINFESENEVIVEGANLKNFKEPEDIIYAGNSGTTVRIGSGILASLPFLSILTGDESLRKRPMKRIVEPLRKMGAKIFGRKNNSYLPLVIKGGKLKPISYKLPIASAQVKSCILLAGIFCEGKTEVIEPYLSRDHTERMLRFFGAFLEREGLKVNIYGRGKLSSQEIVIPGDFSSAAYFIVGALIKEGSEILIKNVGINPTRIGLIDVLKRMGAHIEILNKREISNEEVADIYVKSSKLKAIKLNEKEIVPRMIDEFPILFVAAAKAEGISEIRNIKELRVKESDRISSMAEGLRKFGVNVEELEDGIIIEGRDSFLSCQCNSFNDHRVAMALSILALSNFFKTKILNIDCINVSFPNFFKILKNLSPSSLIEFT